MFIPVSQLYQYKPEEHKKVTERWKTKEGKLNYEHIIKLIREGAGKHFLQSDWENGKFGDLLDDFTDLRGFEFWKENINFPPNVDNFVVLDFSYSNFWHSTFKNMTYHSDCYFGRFYNCQFVKSNFHFAYFMGCTFENCSFEDVDFIQHCLFDNCIFINTKFNNYFFPDRLFENCKFTSSVELNDPSFIPIDKNWKLEFNLKNLEGFYISIREAYKDGGAHDKEWNYYYKAKHASTRYNNKGFIDKYTKLIFNELLIGYGEKPTNCLKVSVFILILFAFLYMFVGLGFAQQDSSVSPTKEMVNYDINISYFIKNIFNPNYYWQCFKDFSNFLYFSIVTFTTVGYGDITLINPFGRFLSALEMLLGVTLIGAWVATFFRKLIR
ncbi:MAG: pentapeptide repeat-containing protein [Candidatus Cloacimonetes bacterium]|nr:pentapeptide repeat-containing protein [Candidatus Cloacimonadota bacterium]